MTATTHRTASARQVFFHDASAPPATVVTPSVFVAALSAVDELLLVRRCDSGTWELPGGCVDVGEDAATTAVRETAEEAGVQITVTGIVGLFTDPGVVVRAPTGLVRQQFALIVRASATGGVPRGDLRETSAAAWVPRARLSGLRMEPHVRCWIARAMAEPGPPHLG